MSDLDFSVVVPAYNEEANIEGVYTRLRDVLDGLGLRWELHTPSTISPRVARSSISASLAGALSILISRIPSS